MSRFESSRFVRNPQIMHVDVLKSACEALGWTYHVVSNELLVTDAKQNTKLYGEFALKLNLTTNEVTYNTYYMPNAVQKVEELQNRFYALNAAYAKKSLVQESSKRALTISQTTTLHLRRKRFTAFLWSAGQKTRTKTSLCLR